MNQKRPYRKWGGVVLGLLLHGSAHFLSGKRAVGLRWYFGILACSFLPTVVAAVPGMVTYAVGLLLWLVAIVLWGIMLKQSCRPVPRIGFRGWVAVIAISVGLNYGWAGMLGAAVDTFRLPSGGMSPTVQPGDCLFIERISTLFGQPERGDIVVFKTAGIASLPPDAFYLQRIAGLPGDRIRIEPPNLLVNDRVVTDPPIFARIAAAAPPFAGFQLAHANIPPGTFLSRPGDEVVLGDDQFFLLGDNTRSSLDSRYWGPVPRENIVGRATRIYWPLSRIGQSLGKE